MDDRSAGHGFDQSVVNQPIRCRCTGKGLGFRRCFRAEDRQDASRLCGGSVICLHGSAEVDSETSDVTSSLLEGVFAYGEVMSDVNQAVSSTSFFTILLIGHFRIIRLAKVGAYKENLRWPCVMPIRCKLQTQNRAAKISWGGGVGGFCLDRCCPSRVLVSDSQSFGHGHRVP